MDYRLIKRSVIPIIFAIFLAFVCGKEAFSAHPLITDDAYTLGKGSSQLELSGEYLNNKDTDAGTTTNAITDAAVFTYGIIAAVDILLTSAYRDVRDNTEGEITRRNGITDLGVDFKWRFYEDNGFSFAIKPGIIFPTGDDDNGLGSGKMRYRFFFISSAKSEPFALHLNIGYLRNENNVDERKDIFHASLAGEWKVGERWKLVADTGIETCADTPHKEDPAFVLLGVIYSITRMIDVDLGIKQGITGTEDKITLSGAVTFRF